MQVGVLPLLGATAFAEHRDSMPTAPLSRTGTYGDLVPMTTLCETCGQRPATVRDFTLRSGSWVEAEVCDSCARRRRTSALPVVGSALAAVEEEPG